MRLDDFVLTVTDGDHQPPPQSPQGVPFLVISDVNTGVINFENARYVSQSYYDSLPSIRKATCGDILFTVTGSYGIVIKVNTLRDFCFQRHIGLIKTILCSDWLYYALQSQYVKRYCDDVATGTAQKTVSLGNLRTLVIPIPPLNEQVRIVAELERLFAIIDSIENSKYDLQESVRVAKSKILNLAIHGRLVSQDPNDEPASELLKRIAPHAAPCDTSHYENLPASWSLATIEQLCTIIGGLWTGKKPPFVRVGVIRNTNFSKDFKLDLTNVAYIDVESKQFAKRQLEYGDLILEKSGGSEKQPVGRTILFDRKESGYSYSNFTAVLRINDKNIITPNFLYYALLDLYLKGSTRHMQKQTTGIHNLIMDKYIALTIPIPPISEQNRIVKAISDIYNILDNISAEL